MYIDLMLDSINDTFEPRFPHAPLYYVVERDAKNWGVLFSEYIDTWLDNFLKHPETLTD